MKKIRRWLISHGWTVVLAATIGYLMGQYLPGVPGSLENRVGAIESRLGPVPIGSVRATQIGYSNWNDRRKMPAFVTV
jgi:hypothetical protein